MFIDLTDVLKYEGARKDLDLKLDIKEIEFGKEKLFFEKPVILRGEVINIKDQLILKGKVETELLIKCYRCRDDVLYSTSFKINEMLVRELNNDTFHEQILIEKNGIKLDNIVINNLILHMPMKVICSEDCKGLCSNCGTNLNIKKCECKVESIDPRLEKLKDFLKD